MKIDPRYNTLCQFLAICLCATLLVLPSLAHAKPNEEAKQTGFFSNVLSFITPEKKPAPDTATLKNAKDSKPIRKPGQIRPAVKKADTPVHINDTTLDETLVLGPLAKPMPKHPEIRLSVQDAALYKKIFAAQGRNDFKTANSYVLELSDMRLMGYVSYHRFMQPKYITDKDELNNWLNTYGHYAVADDVYRLAKRKFGAIFKKPKRKKTLAHKVVLEDGLKTRPYRTKKRRSSAQKQDVKKLQRRIDSLLRRDGPTKALEILQTSATSKLLDNTEYDILKADIASSYFYLHLLDKAKPLATEAAMRSGKTAPLAGWIAGLTAWAQGDYNEAAKHFEKSATSRRSSEWMRSASSYWAARSHMRNANPRIANQWLKQASLYPRSFYGLIAMQTLGARRYQFDWSLPKQEDSNLIQPILNQATGYRAIALLDAGQQYIASEELQTIQISSNDRDLKEALFVLASRYNMPALSMQLASSVKRENGRLYDTALYPLSPWQPHNGFVIDPALIHAFIRQESRFHPRVESRSGAHGLMQIMPMTASYLARKPKNFFKKADGQELLMEPQYNMTLGQEYLSRLLTHPSVNNNMFKLAAAYNAGPGRLRRWQKKMAKTPSVANDPLLFIEMLPAAETRVFVEKVMTNYWIYNLRFHGKMPRTLKATATGAWPNYAEDNPVKMAEKFARPRRTE